MISKKLFCKVLDTLIKQDDYTCEFDTLVRKLNDDLKNDTPYVGDILFNNNNQDLIIDILSEDLGDNEDWISWFVYEKNFGRNEKYNAEDEDGNIIDLSTPEKFYDFLCAGEK